MHKLEIEYNKDDERCTIGTDKQCITFVCNIEKVDIMIGWLFDNTKGRFVILGTNTLYFEKDEDAVAFKLRWT